MSDLIDRQAAIDALKMDISIIPFAKAREYVRAAIETIYNRLEELPPVQPDLDEWCTDCKEYDQERHCCPRWNKVIRETLKDAQPEIIRCKDCKHRKCFYENFTVCDEWGGRRIVKDDDFCSRGVRRTDEQTDER